MTHFSVTDSSQINLKRNDALHGKSFPNDAIPIVPIKLGKRKRDDDLVNGDIDHYEGESKSQITWSYRDQSFYERTNNFQNKDLSSNTLSLSENSKYLAQSQETQENLYRRFKNLLSDFNQTYCSDTNSNNNWI